MTSEPNSVFQVKSSSSSKTYEVDIAACTCTCPDWQKHRGQYLRGEPMRLCKHLVKLTVEKGLASFYGSEQKKLLKAASNGWGYFEPKPRDDSSEDEQETKNNSEHFIGLKLDDEDFRSFKKIFGGVNWRYNFTMYASRLEAGPITIHAPEGDHYRWRLVQLARTGVVKTGKDLEPRHILEAIKMNDLRQIAREHADGIKFRKKEEGIDAILKAGVAVAEVLPLPYSLDDLFRLEPLTIDRIREISTRYQEPIYPYKDQQPKHKGRANAGKKTGCMVIAALIATVLTFLFCSLYAFSWF